MSLSRSPDLTRDAAINLLVERLFWSEERFLPEGETWEALPEIDQGL
jgi:hypothetical protein